MHPWGKKTKQRTKQNKTKTLAFSIWKEFYKICPGRKQGQMFHLTGHGGGAYDPSTQTGGALCVPGQPGLHRQTLSQ